MNTLWRIAPHPERTRLPSLAALLISLAMSACTSSDAPFRQERLGALRSALAVPIQAPAVARDVALSDGNPTSLRNEHTYPTMPPFRLSADGRIGIDMRRGGNVQLYLLSPESVTEPFSLATVDPAVTPYGTKGVLERHDLTHADVYDAAWHAAQGHAWVALTHRTLCDPTSQFFAPGDPVNPSPCGPGGTHDCYTLSIISTVEYVDPPPLGIDHGPHGYKRVALWRSTLTVEVDNPKQFVAPGDPGNAHVVSIAAIPDALPGPEFIANPMLEPVVSGDGRLLVGRISSTKVDPNSGATRESSLLPLNIVYSVMGPNDDACDPANWTELWPISHAHWDPNMAPYGLATYPLRDPSGAPIADMVDMQASYPWLDKKGNNLFFTTVGETLFYLNGASLGARYPASCYQPGCLPGGAISEESSVTRGVSFAGLWSHGKMVLIDNKLNNTDYGMGRMDHEHVLLSLYTGAADVRVGSGRDNQGADPAPTLSTRNTTFIDSTENAWFYNDNMRPLTIRDVVWIVNSGKVSAEVAFDDYLDPDVFILAEMSGLLRQQGTGDRMYYDDGWDPATQTFGGAVRVQNGATSLDWVVPTHGEGLGDVRLEPVALGGIVGKGMWLDGEEDALQFDVPVQTTQDLLTTPWYFGLFIDSRSIDDGVWRELIAFPDQTAIILQGRSTLGYAEAGVVTHTITSPVGPLPAGWSHLGFVVDGNQVRFYFNGYLVDDYTAPSPLFKLSTDQALSEPLYVGDAPVNPTGGFEGWIDEFKAIAYEPNVEVICNHARGTLVGFAVGDGGVDEAFAALPAAAAGHAAITAQLTLLGQPSHDRYACTHNYAGDFEATRHLGTIVAPRHALRSSLLFPEGPLHAGSPRPDVSVNPFCLSCHRADPLVAPTLSIDALTPLPVLMPNDLRRQPMQPPRVMFGNVPAWLFGTGPAAPVSATAHPIDPYLFP